MIKALLEWLLLVRENQEETIENDGIEDKQKNRR